jgi:hypothetical protein
MGAGAGDIGLGDALQNQTEAEILERRKRMLAMVNSPLSAYGVLNSGLQSGVGNLGSAWQALMGPGGY